MMDEEERMGDRGWEMIPSLESGRRRGTLCGGIE